MEIVECQPQYHFGDVNEQGLAGDVSFQYAFAVYVEKHEALGGLLDHSPVRSSLSLSSSFALLRSLR